MLVFAAIVPHSPLLLPTIGKEHHKKLKKTLTAYAQLTQAFATARPDTVLVFSAHAGTLLDSFPLIVAPSLRANLKEFGDLAFALERKPDLQIIETIRRLRYGSPPIAVNPITEEFIDYGSAVPLHFLTAARPEVKAAIVGDAQFSLQQHYEFGTHLAELVQQSTTRIAVVASADLAHTLTDSAPGGFSPAGKKFDAAVVQALRKDDHQKVLKLDTQMADAKACGLRVIAMLLGVLHETNCTPKILAYEGPFGVGYLTAHFVLP